MYAHCHRLFDSVVSTKEPLEDLIGVLTDTVKRGQKNPFRALAPERAYFDQSRKLRWDPDAFPIARVLGTDFQDKEMMTLERNRSKLFTINPKVVKTDSRAVEMAMQALGVNPRGGVFLHDITII